ncbi:hypothetical protein AB0H73_37075 [Streptomyces olivoreticuli]
MTDKISHQLGAAGHDRIIVTVSTWNIPPAWTDQLADDWGS